MDRAELLQIAETVADVLTARGLVKTAPMQFCPLSLTVAQFGIAINRSPKVVRRKIAARFIAREHVFGPPYSISRDALAKFKVSFPLAAERLAAAAAAPAPQPTPVPTAQPSAA